MFGNKENVNILTSLLVGHGVRRAVVCPGSRNAPIVHNLNECGEIKCYPVTDERSAGFYALGMSLADDAPVVVCVTSGTALLNLAPAVAEASYQHHGLIVISADRLSAWIGQLDGQTLHQQDALGCFVCKSVSLPECHDDVERWHCNRLVNEALIAAGANGRMSVHINVPISEPLFEFDVKALPMERKINVVEPALDVAAFERCVLLPMSEARRPMLVVGQINRNVERIGKELDFISRHIAVLSEPLSGGTQTLADLALAGIDDTADYRHDFLLYVGDTIVSKRIKRFLREAGASEVWCIAEDGEVHDTFMCQIGVVKGSPVEGISALSAYLKNNGGAGTGFADLWRKRIDHAASRVWSYEPAFSQMAAVREFEMSLADMDYPYHVHYANSNAIRLACIYASRHVWCNRGVNGIEGSLSTASGFSVATADLVFCVIGDLSFFYDQNALWNTNLKGNLRIILLNNSCGGIFYSLPGLRESAAFGRLVSAGHNTDAKGICAQNDVGYMSARCMEELRLGLATLLTADASRPMLLEVFTDAEDDKRVISNFIKHIKG